MLCVCIEVVYVCNSMCYVQRIELKLCFGVELRYRKAIIISIIITLYGRRSPINYSLCFGGNCALEKLLFISIIITLYGTRSPINYSLCFGGNCALEKLLLVVLLLLYTEQEAP